MKIETEKKLTHGEFAKYMVDKFGVASFERNLADGEWFGAPSDIYNASINLKPSKYDDFPHNVRISEDSVTLKTFEEITEDTVFEILLEIRKSKDIYTYSFESTNKIADSSTKELHAYIDGEFKLIWKNGKLVE